MMDAGRSFSGNERNCFFINLGNGKFADISGLSGLDFPDDGRAISVTDWDNDGDLDLWITNRTAPRLRLMRNDTKEDNPFISILLKGNGETVNKDAIGARIEIINGKNSEKFKQIQTLRAYILNLRFFAFFLSEHPRLLLIYVLVSNISQPHYFTHAAVVI